MTGSGRRGEVVGCRDVVVTTVVATRARVDGRFRQSGNVVKQSVVSFLPDGVRRRW